MRESELYLNDILRAIGLIEKSVRFKDFGKFKSNRDLIDATCMRLQIIGESIGKLPADLKKKYSDVDWKRFLQTRNIISHAYFAVNPRLLWSGLVKDLPKLKKDVKEILKNEK